MLERNRKSIRLKYYDYSKSAYYFVTICVKDKVQYFGSCRKGYVCLSEIGVIAYQEIISTSVMRKNVEIKDFIVMPDHVHMIVKIKDRFPLEGRIAMRPYNGPRNEFGPQKNNLASIVRGYKSSVKRECNRREIPFYWLGRYWDRIIRDERELFNVQRYIKNNPKKWKVDKQFH